MKLTKRLIKLIEHDTSCGVNDEGDYFSIYVDNTCGEDFTFEVNKGKEELEEILSYCDDFDVGEHFKLWYGVGRGEPSDPEVLMNNCKEIAENLEELAEVIRKSI